MRPAELRGEVQFKDVSFKYPARPDVPILNGLSLSVPTGKTVALVGSSGCGKSTCIQLLQRFYDPEAGEVLLDGHNIKNLNIGWLRDQIGVVGQEPVLFDFTIRENILMGRQTASPDEVERVCKEANAWNFISKLPKGLDTKVGEGGTQMSGGQKQRIAIARALIRNPKILLLDEATSALDTESESVVQAALDKARHGRTTVVVAHRLSTIRSADMIVAVDAGRVVEVGTHQQLMENQALYHSLVTRQMEGKVAQTEKEKHDDGRRGSREDPEGDDEFVPNDTQIGKFTRQLSQRLSRRLSSSKPSGKPRTKSESPSVKEVEDADEDLPEIKVGRIMMKNKPEWGYMFLGAVASCGMGAVMPFFGIVFGEILGVLGYEDVQEARDASVTYAFVFLAIGIGSAAVMLIQAWMFAISGENLTMRLRKEAFEAMMSQEMGWFDMPANNTGALCARLSGDAAKIQGATGARVGNILQGIAGVVIASILGLYINWKLGLVCMVFFPMLVVAVIMQQNIINGVDSVEKVAFEQSAKLAIEAITNMRTVAGLRGEQRFIDMYTELLSGPHNLTIKKSHLRGFIFGFSQAVQFFAWGVTMWYGGYLVDQGETDFDDVFKVVNAVLNAAGMIGYSFALTADFNKAMVAAGRVFNLLDRKPLIDARPSTGLKLPSVEGNIDFKEADFFYPTRPTIQIMRKLMLSIKKGENIALVGESGCGKSTVIQLIQRFYDLSSGTLNVEGQDIQSLNLPFVRSTIGIVSQEPVLFDRTIAENIKYGDNSREVSIEEVIEASRRANIHSFVSSLPEGYDTRVGGKGTQLSGGQKQRVAIARALVRNPRVLLLDEATSALDTESEKIVQDALDAAQVGRTSITIAHRLSTIKGASQIYIIEKGQVVEAGTHEELLDSQGAYYRLWNNSTT